MARSHSKIAALAAIGVISVSAVSSFSDGFLKEAGKDAWQLAKGSVRPYITAQNGFEPYDYTFTPDRKKPYDDSLYSGTLRQQNDTARPSGDKWYGGAELEQDK